MSRLYTKLGGVNEAQQYAQQAATARTLPTTGENSRNMSRAHCPGKS